LESDEGDDQIAAIQASIDALSENVEKAAAVGDKFDGFEKRMIIEMGKLTDAQQANNEANDPSDSYVSARGIKNPPQNLMSSGLSGRKDAPVGKPPISKGGRVGYQTQSLRDNRGEGGFMDQTYGTNDPSIKDSVHDRDSPEPEKRYGKKDGFGRKK